MVPEHSNYHSCSVRSQLSRLLSEKGKVFLPGSAEFEDSRFRFTEYGCPVRYFVFPYWPINHLRFQKTYIAVVHPITHFDVAKSIQYAHLRRIPCTAKGGGHCVTNSMKSLQNGILIDMHPLKDLSYDPEKEQVTAGGGVQSGEFLEFVHSVNRETSMYHHNQSDQRSDICYVAVGSCPTTGLMGVAIGGGISLLQGKYG
jgi:FAD/FMN-containing dehydrogenase